MTLDRQYMETINVPGLADAIDVTDDGSLLYDANNELREMNKAGDDPDDLELPRPRFGAQPSVLLEHDQLERRPTTPC